ncbi:hypothetical protein GCM10009860_17980 [Microbacterium mitrae]|uniref:SRPBCC domain-containing protein n=1 Tax=Microbacterium mitrae TaxID=664640 RepID=A0A5C8HQ27_9MICO|nr:SRPBCC domain-containing protein [Microbacterium mitrae]TXK04655.1 SRPBCC domain-containing protein [Microbacterium mitrae]
MADEIIVERTLNASRQAVYDAIVTADSFRVWFGTDAVAVPREEMTWDARVGGQWTAVMHLPDGEKKHWAGEFAELVEPTRVVLLITDEPESPDRLAVSFDLDELSDAETRLVLHQPTPGWPAEAQEGLRAGYNAFIDSMQRLLAVEIS